MPRFRTAAVAALSGLTAMSVLAACSSSSSSGKSSSSPAGPVKIEVVSLLPGSEKAAFDAFNAQVKQFEAKYPNIQVAPREYEWKATTFAAQLAGGTLPTVFTVPFTDGKGLIERKQVADLDSRVKQMSYAGSFNPKVIANGQGSDGHIYGVPTQAYGIGLQYNRALFTKAGLDPDKPPTTWDEIRTDAKQIAEKTGQAGFAQMTKDATGGWMLSTLTYALGGRMEHKDGDKYKATVNNDQTKAALRKLKDMRWSDNAMGSNFLYDWGGINQAFAAGKIGMYMGGSDVYTSLLRTNNIKPSDYGLATLPLDSSSSDAGVLGGGTLAVVSVKSNDAQKDAAMKWIDFYFMNKLATQSGAELDAKTLAANQQPVGTPSLPIFDKATYDKSQEWIKSYINVPLTQMSSFTSGIFNQNLVNEPPAHTQELYKALDPVVQSVLTNKNADIDRLLDSANRTVQSVLDKG